MTDEDQMFPGGNTTIARLIVKNLIPGALDGPESVKAVTANNINFAALDTPQTKARVRLSSTAISVQHDREPNKSNFVSISYLKDGKIYRVKARSAVLAGGSWATKHIVQDLPESHRRAYAEFCRSPCMMANVAVRNWRFLYKMGFEGTGNYMEVRKTGTHWRSHAVQRPPLTVRVAAAFLFRKPTFCFYTASSRV
jgi:spermidine dehydrogenase